MDLERIGAAQLGSSFLSRYRSLAADDAPASLEHFFIAYRALVRAKVACLLAGQGDDQAATQALLLAVLCRDHVDAATNQLVLVGGLPGSGKSTVAAGLAAAGGHRLLSSDRIRLETAELPADRYSDAGRALVYEHALERARTLLRQGYDVVLDATFGELRWRQQARALGGELHAQVVELVCVAPDAVAIERLRNRPPGDSDATPLVRLALEDRWAPWPEATEIDCSAAAARAVCDAVRVVCPTQP